ncbi:aminotransferase class V-fold PLP-dependent enzyme [Nitrosomonas sp. Nm166]|uniref:aminotransferase class V-fold PLP-dependent enzyme n=1 Tax=Nitrosomonas sp. Nm166 TaxID=1881054 RepID=UPI0008F42CCA|nr:aminotransferase class V-fold PLP-dependent enzyme [Nitrosomonas sp. Nm166]SFE47297.1 Selenocysteine lyase/Cysteine desulfurase [Nitrosomonas sp. Nm166]
MSMTRRNFLLSAGCTAVACTALPSAGNASDHTHDVFNPHDWHSVRAQFNLSPNYIHLTGFYIASHPRPVREAIARYSKAIDENPFLTIENGLFGEPQSKISTRVCEAAAAYGGGKSSEYAITSNTTSGLALIYHGLMLKPGQDILTTEHDHYAHQESLRLAAEKAGAFWRRIALFERSSDATEDEIVGRLVKAVRSNTRIIGLTWVQSSTGVRLPIRKIANALAEINRGRDDADRVLLVVDGVHGFGAVDESLPNLGCDFFSAGTHKWIFAPRGTGILWAHDSAWAQMRPTIPSFIADEPFDAWMKREPPKPPTRADWVAPGGFYAYEHQWAMQDAFEFQRQIGRTRIARRIEELNSLCKEELAKMPHVMLHTPLDPGLSAGIICFEVAGLTPQAIVEKLLERHIIASTSPYATSYARLSFGIMNTPQEVDVTLRAICGLARG